jgi:CheY-like chemotaxis protein
MSTAASPPSTGPRVLVVDDNIDAAQSLGQLIGLWGYDVHVAFDGLEALQVGRDVTPDIVLLDLLMPRMDGWEAAHAIRGEPWGRDVLLIAASAWSKNYDVAQFRECGFDHALVKPIDAGQLQRLLEQQPRARAATTSSGPQAVF